MNPYFANASIAPFVSGFGEQPMPGHPRRHRHHRHRKNKHAHENGMPMNQDETAHKLTHGQNQYSQPNENMPPTTVYSTPYGTVGYNGSSFSGFNLPQQKYPSATFGYNGKQVQEDTFGINPMASVSKRHRRHHRRQAEEVLTDTVRINQAESMPEQSIGEQVKSASPVHTNVNEQADQVGHAKLQNQEHHHHHVQNFDEQIVSKPSRSSRRTESKHGHSSVGSDGYGHLQDDIIFIERGEGSPHRQEPPPGYEYKGRIEVQCAEKQGRSRSRGRVMPPVPPPPRPLPPPLPPQPQVGPCPPGWQQVMVNPQVSPCPPGTVLYNGQGFGGGSIGQAGLGGFGGFGGSAGGTGFGFVGPMGTTGTGGLGGYSGTTGSQFTTDYVVESGGGSSHYQYTDEGDSRVVTRTKIIEVWQKRGKSESHRESRSRSRSRSRERPVGPSFDFERFRQEVLMAIERITQNIGGKATFISTDGSTQTQIRPAPTHHEAGEVRVIVQPIQPVFYMPRPSETTGPTQVVVPGTAPTQAQAPHVVYVPRNVYVPVIKPVFVPRERVIVRPQVIHVAKPVLVDRPVPVTQRPIIIDRERPVPVPVRTAGQAAQTGGTNIVREEYVYRDNLPVAYGGRCPEYAGGVNYGYMPTQQEHQYAAGSTYEESVGYQTAGAAIDVPAATAYEQTQSVGYVGGQQDYGAYQQSYVDTAQTSHTAGHASSGINCSGLIEVLDTTVNPSWRRTDQSTLANCYGPAATDIVHKTDQVEQQMFQELRRGGSVGNFQRSSSAATFVSSGNAQLGPRGRSFSSIPPGGIDPACLEMIGAAPVPVRINY